MNANKIRNSSFITLIAVLSYFLDCLAFAILNVFEYAERTSKDTTYILGLVMTILFCLIGIVRCFLGMYEITKNKEAEYSIKGVISVLITLLCLRVTYYVKNTSIFFGLGGEYVGLFFFCTLSIFAAAVVGCVGLNQVKKYGRLKTGSIFGLAVLGVFIVFTTSEFIVLFKYVGFKVSEYVLLPLTLFVDIFFAITLINAIVFGGKTSDIEKPEDKKPNKSFSPKEKLEELKDLYESGLITEEEYEETRKKYVDML